MSVKVKRLHQVSSHPGLETLELRTQQPIAELHARAEQTLVLVFSLTAEKELSLMILQGARLDRERTSPDIEARKKLK